MEKGPVFTGPFPFIMQRQAGTSTSRSGFSVTTASVVSRRPAIDAAFWSAVRVTLVGSMTPAATRSSYSSVRAL
jgi:hypothetical protein